MWGNLRDWKAISCWNLKALYEDSFKLDEFTAFFQHLVMQVMPELHILPMVLPKAHMDLQAMLINVQQYKPTWIAVGIAAVPYELDFPRNGLGE